MDQNVLVSSGHTLVKALDAAGLAPRIAIWVHGLDDDSWRLWIVPPSEVDDKREFYGRLSEVISKHRAELGDLSAGDIEMASANHPAMAGIGRHFPMEGLGSAPFSGNRFNGFYLPAGIILRATLPEEAPQPT
ncbi:hypothetical protein RA307_26340 [Xanthobacteraceae bacterium Astr-EGSB]|uniref:hypothetical protein n=1 Tax=Astrobacterium formosum TaxID=3069710 RepID=UPI0027AEEFA1|nr:hypothetical protein [Xanthobacteraceae bacterium Astr-EGSB]